MDIFGGHYSVDHSNCPLHPTPTTPLSLLASKGDCKTLWSWNSPGESQHQALCSGTPHLQGTPVNLSRGLALHIPVVAPRWAGRVYSLASIQLGTRCWFLLPAALPNSGRSPGVPRPLSCRWEEGGKGSHCKPVFPISPRMLAMSCLEKERPDAGQLDLMKRCRTDSPRWHKMGQVNRTENWH